MSWDDRPTYPAPVMPGPPGMRPTIAVSCVTCAALSRKATAETYSEAEAKLRERDGWFLDPALGWRCAECKAKEER